MTTHPFHQMRDTSLLLYMEEYKNINFEEKIRNKVHLQIIQTLQLNPQGLTDRELQHELNYNERNVVSPRRHELVNGTKRHPELAGILEDAGVRICNITQRKTHYWTLNKNRLYAYVGV